MKAECPNCGWSKEVSEDAQGRKGKCPQCGALFEIGPVPTHKVGASAEVLQHLAHGGRMEERMAILERANRRMKLRLAAA